MLLVQIFLVSVTLWLGVSGRCDRLSRLSRQCQCTHKSFLTCTNVTSPLVLEELFKSTREAVVLSLDAVRLIDPKIEAFIGPYSISEEFKSQIQVLEILNSDLPDMPSKWDKQFWKGIDGTFSMIIRRVIGLNSWEWEQVTMAFPSLQYLEIDQSPMESLPDDFGIFFTQLVSLTITNSALLVIGERSLHCAQCNSIHLGDNSIQYLKPKSFKTGVRSSFYLDLRNNSLQKLPSDIFQNLQTLNSLRIDLNGNPLESLQESLFFDLRNLKRIDVRFRDKPKITTRGFICNCSMRFLSRETFDINHLYCSEINSETTFKVRDFVKSCPSDLEQKDDFSLWDKIKEIVFNL